MRTQALFAVSARRTDLYLTRSLEVSSFSQLHLTLEPPKRRMLCSGSARENAWRPIRDVRAKGQTESAQETLPISRDGFPDMAKPDFVSGQKELDERLVVRWCNRRNLLFRIHRAVSLPANVRAGSKNRCAE